MYAAEDSFQVNDLGQIKFLVGGGANSCAFFFSFSDKIESDKYLTSRMLQSLVDDVQRLVSTMCCTLYTN